MGLTGSKLRGVTSSVARWLEGGRRSLPLAIAPAEELLLDRPVALPAEPAEGGAMPEAGARAERRLLATIFDSAHPVRDRDELFGRDQELDDLLAASLDFRQHSVVYGARGSGKTSLVRVFGDYADQNGVVVIYMACEPGVTFAELMRPYLRSIPPSALGAGMKERFRQEVAALPDQFGPRAFVELVAETVASPLVLIFDEFDRITDPAVKGDVAAAMKLLSDALSSVLFMLVGIARNVADVVDAHPSLRRHMRTVSLGRIEQSSVEALIDRGADATGFAFAADAREMVKRAACGSPFHVRMFCHHAGLAALKRKSLTVDEPDARAGLASAFRQWGAMNDEDADTFVRLADDPAKHGELERVARASAVADLLAESALADSPAVAMLGDALRRDGAAGTITFRDSVAPQFLIALIILMQADAVPAPARATGREPHDAVHR